MNSYLKALPSSIFSGLVVGSIVTFASVAFSAMIYHGDLHAYMLLGTSSTLLGTLLLLITVGLLSSSKNSLAQAQDVFAAMMAVITYKIARSLIIAYPNDLLSTLMASMVIAALASGLFMFFLGRLRLGNLIRYIPYPVIGGFLAGTGILLFLQTLQFLTDLNLNQNQWHLLLSPVELIQWLPACLYALFMLMVLRQFKHYLTLPFLIILGFVSFYAGLKGLNLSMTEIKNYNLLMSGFPNQSLLQLPSAAIFSGHIHWQALASCIPDYIILMLLAAVSLLLNASSFEIMTKESLNINQELKANGIGNILTALVGGLGGYQGLAISHIDYKHNPHTRLTAITAALSVAAFIVFGASVLNYIPRAVFGALLFYVAFDFVWEWLILIRKKISWAYYIIVLSIAVLIALKGFLTGLLIGVLLSLIFFGIQYSKVRVIRSFITADIMRSGVERTEKEKNLLKDQGNKILIPIISGYLFFGNAPFIFDKIIQEIKERHNIRYLIIDFSRLSGIEISCFLSLVKIIQWCQQQQVSIIFSHLPLRIKKEIHRFIRYETHSQACYKELPDLDRALEWCEDDLLVQYDHQPSQAEIFQFLNAKTEENKALLSYFEPWSVAANQVIYRQGEVAEDLIYVAHGELQVFMHYGQSHELRLSKIKAGAVIGEMGLLLDELRSATVIASVPSNLYRINRGSLQKLYKEDPRLGLRLNELIIQLLGHRLRQANAFSSFVKMSL